MPAAAVAGCRVGGALDISERAGPGGRSEEAKEKEATDGEARGRGPGDQRRYVMRPCHGRDYSGQEAKEKP